MQGISQFIVPRKRPVQQYWYMFSRNIEALEIHRNKDKSMSLLSQIQDAPCKELT